MEEGGGLLVGQLVKISSGGGINWGDIICRVIDCAGFGGCRTLPKIAHKICRENIMEIAICCGDSLKKMRNVRCEFLPKNNEICAAYAIYPQNTRSIVPPPLFCDRLQWGDEDTRWWKALRSGGVGILGGLLQCRLLLRCLLERGRLVFQRALQLVVQLELLPPAWGDRRALRNVHTGSPKMQKKTNS